MTDKILHVEITFNDGIRSHYMISGERGLSYEGNGVEFFHLDQRGKTNYYWFPTKRIKQIRAWEIESPTE